jgi:hypothetical protein
MFHNVAPVLPEAALSALERVSVSSPYLAASVWRQHLPLLRSLAYDPPLFERSVQMLARAALENGDERAAKEISDAFVSLFPICLSGTHATIEQRLAVIERLLRSDQSAARALGLRAMDAVLKTSHFSGGYQFEFGARSRDYGFFPDNEEKLTHWYSAALTLIERLAPLNEWFSNEMRGTLARNFNGLWTIAGVYDQTERLSHRFAADGFWREGWFACKQTLRFGRSQRDQQGAARLTMLEAVLRPSNITEQVMAIALSERSGTLELEELEAIDDDFTEASARLESRARELGEIVGADDTLFEQLLPVMLRGGVRAWTLGQGVAATSPQTQATWARFVEELAKVPPEQQDVQVLRGFLAELWKRDHDLVHSILDAMLATPDLAAFVPLLQTAVDIDKRGMGRLERALLTGVPVRMYRFLAYGRVTDRAPAGPLKDLLLLIAGQPDGFDVALEILSMRFHSDRSDQRDHEPELLLAGAGLLRHIKFCTDNSSKAYQLAEVVKACLAAADVSPHAADVARQLRDAVASHKTYSFNNNELLTALLEVQPVGVLDALFAGSDDDRAAGVDVFDCLGAHRNNPADTISCDTLIEWCNADAVVRYPLAAEFVSFSRHAEESESLVWSEQAVALLVGAPNPGQVLSAFIARFQPTSWSGSRAAIIEANSRLLDSISSVLPSLEPVVIAAKVEITEAVSAERRRETARDRVDDERFEW